MKEELLLRKVFLHKKSARYFYGRARIKGIRSKLMNTKSLLP